MDDADRIIDAATHRSKLLKSAKESERYLIKVRKGPKNHSTNKERSQKARADSSRTQHQNATRDRLYAAYKDLVRKYWNGEVDNFPKEPS